MTPQQHTDLLNAVLANPSTRTVVATDLISAINDLRSILLAVPRPALEQLIVAVRADNERLQSPSNAIATALNFIESRLDALFTLAQ